MAGKSKHRIAPVSVWAPDDTTAQDRHRLAGLEPDNLLAFMALLGLLRALESVRPAWRPRAFWNVETHPWRPVLTLAEPQTEAAIAAAAVEGVQQVCAPVKSICERAIKQERRDFSQIVSELGGKGDLTEKDKKTLEKARKGLNKPRPPEKVTHIAASAEALHDHHVGQDALRDDWVASLSAIAVESDDKWSAWSSPLKLTSGQQAFGGLFVTLAKRADANEIARSLYQPWEYRHRGDSFRLDPAEARRYAYMASDPTKKQPKNPGETGSGVAPSELGANVLASLAFLSFPLFTCRNAVCFPGMEDEDGLSILAPIWTAVGGRGASLAGIEALMKQAQARHDRLPEGVVGWQRFRIVELGDYKAIAYAGFEAVQVATGIA